MTQRERQLLNWIEENPMISQQELADKAGITLLEMAMGWLISKPAITSIICGSRTVAQAESSAKCGDIQLPADVLSEINAILDGAK